MNQHKIAPYCSYDQLNTDVFNFSQTAAAHLKNIFISYKLFINIF